MIFNNNSRCPACGGELRYHSTTYRHVIGKGRTVRIQKVKVFRCIECGKYHRKIPQGVNPYKQYEKEIIQGVIEGLITNDILGFEDYPCESTMHRWMKSV